MMTFFFPKLPFLCLPCLLLLLPLSTSVTAKVFIPRLGFPWKAPADAKSIETLFKDYMTFYYNQTLDHFNYRPDSFAIFPQRYLINSKYWGGAKSGSPIFVYLGAEAPVKVTNGGFLLDHAPQFKALLVLIEHRYYGESAPFGSLKTAFSNASTLGYFTSTQVLADYAELIVSLKRRYSAESCPVFVFGGSYGGMLAAWFRLKYPHIAMGALASSAPLLYFENLVPWDQYYVTLTKDYKDTSLHCHNTIISSWPAFNKIANNESQLWVLSKKFKTCKPLKDENEVDSLRRYLIKTYEQEAQYEGQLGYGVKAICDKIDTASKKTTDSLTSIAAAITPKNACFNFTSGEYIVSGVGEGDDVNYYRGLGWAWQTCTDMLLPIGVQDEDTSIIPGGPFSYESKTEYCRENFGVTPRRHWTLTEFGGRDIKHVLKKFGSNIIFSNGLRDPWSGAGVLHNISDSIVAIVTQKGSHCMDIAFKLDTDPKWLVDMRKTEVELIKGWIAEYYEMHRND